MLRGYLYRHQRIGLVRFIAVEEMLGVVDHLFSGGFKKGDTLAYHGQILFQVGLEHVADMEVPAFAHQGDDRRLGCQQRLNIGIIGRPGPFAPG